MEPRDLADGGQLVASVRAHYPAEAAELDQLNKTIGMAVALSLRAKVATFAHLLETINYHSAHSSRHADEMRQRPGTPALWKFNAKHCSVHVDDALDHAGKLAEHIRDNYPAEAGYLGELGRLSGLSPARAGRKVKSWR